METEIVKVEAADGVFTTEEEKILEHAGEIIKKGGLVAFPTETVYGLGGDAMNPESSKKIYAAKGRPSDNPLIVHIADFEDIYKIAREVPENAKKLADVFWPGPMTMILPKKDIVPKETTGGLETVAVRFPSDPIAQRFIRESGGFIAAPSANISGRPSPTQAEYVIQDMDGRIDMIIDGGENEIGLESTIVDLTVTPPQVLRPGFITREMLQKALDETVEIDKAIIDSNSKIPPRAPGMKYRHYAPKGTLVIVEGDREKVTAEIQTRLGEDKKRGFRTGVIASDETVGCYTADSVKSAGHHGDINTAAHRLYTILRSFDDDNIERIYSESFDCDGVGAALMNRLMKAAGHQIISV